MSLEIWNKVKKTDISATKQNTQGGRSSTSINGYSMIQKATELWGPVGGEWGYDIIEERFDKGAPIINKDGVVLCDTIMHTIRLKLWYPGCKESGITQYGHTPYVYQSKHGPITDTEAPKKSLMDAIKKCLSMLGFSADVFTGEFDDVHYKQELMNEQNLQKAEDKVDESAKQYKEYQEWIEKNLHLISTAQTLNELAVLYGSAVRKLQLRNDEQNKVKFARAHEKRKAELEKDNETV